MKKIFGYIFVVILLLMISHGNNYFYPIPYFLFILTFVLIVAAVLLKFGGYDRKTLTIFVIFLLFQLFYIIRYKALYIGFPIKLLTALSIAYYFKLDYLKYFVKIMSIMAMISIIFSLFTIIDFKATYEGLKSLSLSLGIDETFHFDGDYYANIFIYTINQTDLFRNCGFMWEPGPFSSLLTLAIFFELLFNKHKFTLNVFMLLVALILTFSTTGYLSLLVIIFHYLFNKYSTRSVWKIIPLVLVITFGIMSLPFMTEKISNLAHINQNKVYGDFNSVRAISLGRFNSWAATFIDLKKSPIFGVGNSANTFATRTFKSNINGIATLLSFYGLLGLFLFSMALYKSTIFLKKVFKLKFIVAFPLLIIIQSFSFVLNFSILYMSIFFLYVAQYRSSRVLGMGIYSSKAKEESI